MYKYIFIYFYIHIYAHTHTTSHTHTHTHSGTQRNTKKLDHRRKDDKKLSGDGFVIVETDPGSTKSLGLVNQFTDYIPTMKSLSITYLCT